MQNPETPQKNRLRIINTSKFWILALVVIIAIGIYLDVRPHNSGPAAKNQIKSGTIKRTVAKVDITGSGFSPQTLLVKPGTEVTWTNTDTAPHKVAAGPHPLDNSIAGFDSTQLLQKGDSYSFSFEKSGTYYVHDELNPLKFNATIKVGN
jgi:plastocyanin